jgi:hypothetical protein
MTGDGVFAGADRGPAGSGVSIRAGCRDNDAPEHRFYGCRPRRDQHPRASPTDPHRIGHLRTPQPSLHHARSVPAAHAPATGTPSERAPSTGTPLALGAPPPTGFPVPLPRKITPQDLRLARAGTQHEQVPRERVFPKRRPPPDRARRGQPSPGPTPVEPVLRHAAVPAPRPDRHPACDLGLNPLPQKRRRPSPVLHGRQDAASDHRFTGAVVETHAPCGRFGESGEGRFQYNDRGSGA